MTTPAPACPESASQRPSPAAARVTTAAFIPAGPARRGPRSPAVPKVSGPAKRRSSSALSPAAISASISARSPVCGSASAQLRGGVEDVHSRAPAASTLSASKSGQRVLATHAVEHGVGGIGLAEGLDQRLGVDLGVVGRLVAQRPRGGEVPPVAGVVRDAPHDAEAGGRCRQRGVDERDGVGGGEPGRQVSERRRLRERAADPQADDVHAVAVGVERAERLHRDLRDAVVRVRPRRGVGLGEQSGGGALGVAGRVVAAGEHDPLDAGAAGGLERGVGALDVDPADGRPGVLADEAGEVHDRVGSRSSRRPSRTRSVASATTCSSPGRSSGTGTTSRLRTAQPRSGSPPRSQVPIRPAAPVIRTRLTMPPRSRGALRSSLVPRCDAHAPVRSRKPPDEVDQERAQPARPPPCRRRAPRGGRAPRR